MAATQARILQQARDAGQQVVDVSLDLGISVVSVGVDLSGVDTPAGLLPWPAIDTVAADEHGCYEVSATDCQRIQCMSPMSGRLATLYATDGPPALLLSGTLMHRIKGVHPGQDTDLKLAPLPRLLDRHVLDTATGLGYTAIRAIQRGAASVHTVELDPAVIEVQSRNPWSAALFEDDRIQRATGDIAQVIETFGDDQFDRILHDPPVLELAGDLYGSGFYRQLHRVLKRRGYLFHYIGNLDSPSGRRVVPGVIRRLEEAGFIDIRRRPEAFGVSARR